MRYVAWRCVARMCCVRVPARARARAWRDSFEDESAGELLPPHTMDSTLAQVIEMLAEHEEQVEDATPMESEEREDREEIVRATAGDDDAREASTAGDDDASETTSHSDDEPGDGAEAESDAEVVGTVADGHTDVATDVAGGSEGSESESEGPELAEEAAPAPGDAGANQ